LKDAVSDRTRLQSIAYTGQAHIRTWSPERNITSTLDAIRIGVTRARRTAGKESVASEVIPKKSAVDAQRQR
jgi:hypothetical protein